MVEDLRGELLTQELPVLIRHAIDTSDISEIITGRATKEQRISLENEAFGEAESFLNFTQREVNDLAKARAYLFEHEGRSPSVKTRQPWVAHTPKPMEASSADASFARTTTAAEASPHGTVPLAKTVGEKDSLRLALVMLALANFAVLGCVFGLWIGWNRAADLGWPWKLLIAAPCYAAAISIAAMLITAADQRMATTVPGLPRRSLDGGTPRVVGGLLLGSSAIAGLITFFDAMGTEWASSAHTLTLVGAFIVWLISAILLVLACILAVAGAVTTLRPLTAGPALGASAVVVLYLIALLIFWVPSAHGIGLTWTAILWGAGGVVTITIGILTASSYRANDLIVKTASSANTSFGADETRPVSSTEFRRPAEPRRQLMPSIPIGQWRQQREELELAVVQAMNRWQEAVTERAILPYLRLRINNILEPRFDRKFSIFDASGLHQARARQHLVKTEALQQFRQVHRTLDGGAVALVGPRGAGKTTILEALTEDEWISGAVGRLLVIENAPLEYQPREFALHLYARLCQQVIQLDVGRHSKAASTLGNQVKRYGMLAAFLLAVFTLGSIVNGSRSSRVISILDWWLLLIVALSVASLALFLILGRLRKKPVPVVTADQKPVSLAVLCEQAQQQLIQIRYLQRHTSGWSGTLSAGGAQATGSRSVEFAQQTMTHPEVVHAFRSFLQKTVEVLTQRCGNLPAPVVIAIDELDRLPAGASTSFVSEIKALFSPPLPGCLYLMAVSDRETFGDEGDGAASLEALHSAFDAIIPVRHLPLSGALELLRSRAIGLPDPFLWLCHCLSGGLPRELIRIARTVVDMGAGLKEDTKEGQEDDLTWISRRVIGGELAKNANILRSTARFSSERLGVPVSEVLRSTRPRPPHSSELLELIGAVTSISTGSDQGSGFTHNSGYQDFSLSAFGQLYLYATVLEAFEANTTACAQEDALRNSFGDNKVLETFDTLAASKPLLSVDPWLGWQLITSFRIKWGMKAYNLPS